MVMAMTKSGCMDFAGSARGCVRQTSHARRRLIPIYTPSYSSWRCRYLRSSLWVIHAGRAGNVFQEF